MSMQSDPVGPTPVDPDITNPTTDPRPPPEPSGCACLVHSVYAISERGSEQTTRIAVPKDTLRFTEAISDDPGETAFSTLTDTGLWNGAELVIPVSGIYYMELSFVRDIGGGTDDTYVHLWRDPAGTTPPPHRLGYAWAGESYGRNGVERETGHFSILTRLEELDKLYVSATVDGGGATRISNLRWNTFGLCCDPSIPVVLPC